MAGEVMATAARIDLERVYGATERGNGARVLVDRVWPRGVRKESLGLDLWLRELGPSNELRKWFGHQPERWEEFRRRYKTELRGQRQQELLDQLAELAQKGPVTLLYGARDEQRNQAVVLREVLQERLRERAQG